MSSATAPFDQDEEDGGDRLAVAALAEQALLGAIMLEPSEIGHIRDWLEPGHFYRPAHQALYRALLDQDGNEHPGRDAVASSPQRLAWIVDAWRSAAATTRGIPAAYPYTLQAACQQSGHAVVYGRMVLEAAIHRTVTEHATRLLHSATTAADSGDVDSVLHHTDVLADVLEQLQRTWTPAEQTPAPAANAGSAGLAQTLTPSVSTEALRDPSTEERLLVATLISAPGPLADLVGWLYPADFTDRLPAEVYRCLGALHHRGDAIDAVTVVWEAYRRGLLSDGTVTAEQILELGTGRFGGDAGYFGQQVLAGSLIRTAAAGAEHIQQLAAGPLPPERLLPQALAALAPLQRARQRWASSEEPHPPPGESPAGDNGPVRHPPMPRPASAHRTAHAHERPRRSHR